MVEAMGIEPMSVESQIKSTTCLVSIYTSLLLRKQISQARLFLILLHYEIKKDSAKGLWFY